MRIHITAAVLVLLLGSSCNPATSTAIQETKPQEQEQEKEKEKAQLQEKPNTVRMDGTNNDVRLKSQDNSRVSPIR